MPITPSEEVLDPIPMNFVDMIRASVMKKGADGQGEAPPPVQQGPQSQPNGMDGMPQPLPRPPMQFPQPARQQYAQPSVKYFHDASGNEFKMVGDELFRKGWKPLAMKARLVKTSTGKTLSMEDREIQVYGWIRMAGTVDDPDSGTMEKETTDAEDANEENEAEQ